MYDFALKRVTSVSGGASSIVRLGGVEVVLVRFFAAANERQMISMRSSMLRQASMNVSTSSTP